LMKDYNIVQPVTFAPAPPPMIAVDMLVKFFIVLIILMYI
jgi:hypothetical protein